MNSKQSDQSLLLRFDTRTYYSKTLINIMLHFLGTSCSTKKLTGRCTTVSLGIPKNIQWGTIKELPSNTEHTTHRITILNYINWNIVNHSALIMYPEEDQSIFSHGKGRCSTRASNTSLLAIHYRCWSLSTCTWSLDVLIIFW